jgi:hypothetical protein
MLSLQRSNPGLMPWFARPIPDTSRHEHIQTHREHHQFVAVSDESATTASSTSTEDRLYHPINYQINAKFESPYKLRQQKFISSSSSEKRPTAHQTHGDFLDLPAGK